MENVSDSNIQKIVDEFESIVREKYPYAADILLQLWNELQEGITDEELDYLAVNIKENWNLYWNALWQLAIKVVWDSPIIEQEVETE